MLKGAINTTNETKLIRSKEIPVLPKLPFMFVSLLEPTFVALAMAAAGDY
jgi:hypothetical protein